MATINADDVRIPRVARDALSRHEEVVVLNRDRPVCILVSPETWRHPAEPSRHGRPLREALEILASAPAPDPAFGDDLRAVRDSVGSIPPDPWAPS